MAIRAAVLFLVAILGDGTLPHRAVGQTPLFLVNPQTQVRSISFSFEDEQSFGRDALSRRLALTAQGAFPGLRGALSFLPLIQPVRDHRFDPVELQKDLIRLRRLYESSGFLGPVIRYEVELDGDANTVAVRFVIHEGRAVRLETVTFSEPDGSDFPTGLGTEFESAWGGLTRRIEQGSVGRRAGPSQIRELEDRVVGWLRDRGYPDASAQGIASTDSASASLALDITVDTGQRKRVEEVLVEGNEGISTAVIRRELPFGPGDWFSASALSEGERELFGLDMIRWADAAVSTDPGPSPDGGNELSSDESVKLLVRVEEGPKRLVSGRAGYASSSGITAQSQWAHRNFLGAARVLTVSAEGRTGLLAADETSERRYGLSVSLRQPYLGSRRMSGLVTPFIEYRDGSIDRSWTNGVDATAIYDLGGLNSASLQYGISARNVLEYRFGTLTDAGTDFLALQTILDDSLGVPIRESRLTLSLTTGSLDNRTRPRQGVVSRVAVQVAGPDALSQVEFAKMTGSVNAFVPVGRDLSARARVSAGRVYPYGKSIPRGADDDGFLRFLELRESLLTSGGTGDVRGWADGLLGPKTPDFRLVEQGDSIFTRADRYIPVGGFARVGFSAEVAVRMPGSARRHSLFAFLDGAKVWTSDSRFALEDPNDEEGFFFGVGGGLEFASVIGPVRVALGYKLNPSPLDVRAPGDVQRALEAGVPIASLPERLSQRFQIHIDLGRLF